MEAITNTASKRYAVVTGANKGIGLEICRQLASNGVTVVLTARDEKRGADAVAKLKESGVPDHVLFHRLDVVDPSSVGRLADFINTQFGRLDILVNNAGILGSIVDGDGFRASVNCADEQELTKMNWDETWDRILTQTYTLAEECLQTNYYGPKRMIEAFLPLLELSDSPKIVNVSSGEGKLQNIPNEWAKGVLGDAEKLTEERVDEVLNEFLRDFKEGFIQAKGWPAHISAYRVSKAALNAYTRIVAKKCPNLIINCVCPGYVNTEINSNTGFLTVEEGAESVVRLALLPDGSPSGLFFSRNELSSFE